MTGEEIIEAVARMMWKDRSGTFPPNVQAMANPWAVLSSEAREAILATLDMIREPSETMVDAADVPMFCDFHEPAVTWRMMIDALKREIAG